MMYLISPWFPPVIRVLAGLCDGLQANDLFRIPYLIQWFKPIRLFAWFRANRINRLHLPVLGQLVRIEQPIIFGFRLPAREQIRADAPLCSVFMANEPVLENPTTPDIQVAVVFSAVWAPPEILIRCHGGTEFHYLAHFCLLGGGISFM